MASPLRKSDRQMAMAKALRYYNGQADPPLRITARVNDNILIPLGRILCDKGAAFLFGRDVQSQIIESAAEGPQKWLDECWRRNKRGIFLQKLALNGGMFGHAFIRLLDTAPFPRVIVLDPQTVEVKTDPDDCDTVWQYTITQPDQEYDNDGDGMTDETVRKRTVIEDENATADDADPEDPPAWRIYDQEYRGGSQGDVAQGAWVTTNERAWPHPFSPVLGCQNIPKPNDYWGESDLPPDVLTTIDGINRVVSMYNRVIRLHAHPKIWTRGMGSQKLDLSADSITHLPSETAELKALEMQSDLSSTMALLEKLLSLLSYAVRIPLIAMGQPDGAGALSGVSLQIRYQPLIEKTEAKRLTYGDLLTECDRCLLAMGNLGDSYLTQIVWPELVPKDPLEERQVWVIDDSIGIVSKKTLADAAGYDYDQERQERAKEAAEDAALIATFPTLDPGGVPPEQMPPTLTPDVAKSGTSR